VKREEIMRIWRSVSPLSIMTEDGLRVCEAVAKAARRAAPADLDADGLPKLPEPVSYCRSDTVMNWKGQLMNVAWMFPSPVGFKNPIGLFTVDQVRQYALDAIAAYCRAREDADTDRLDFMIREECQIEHIDRLGATPLYRVRWPHNDTDMGEWSATGREAIDAAMRAREGICGS